MKIFSVNNLNFSYRKNWVLKNINTDINKGDFIGILGPNGAGKSTYLKILAGLLTPDNGKVLFLNKNIYDYSKIDIAKEMSVVAQNFKNFVPFKADEFISMGLFPHKKFWERTSKYDYEKIENVLKITGIEHLQNRYITELSGGELQLVSIARALVQNMEVILLDEPISNLDLQHTVWVMDLLYKLNRKGATILTVLHDVNIASDYCSRIISLKNGKLFFDSDPAKCITKNNVSKLYDIKCSVNLNRLTGKPNITLFPEFITNKENSND